MSRERKAPMADTAEAETMVHTDRTTGSDCDNSHIGVLAFPPRSPKAREQARRLA